MTDPTELMARLRVYDELGELSSLSIHPQMPGYTTGRLYGDARDAIEAIRAITAERDAALARVQELSRQIGREAIAGMRAKPDGAVEDDDSVGCELCDARNAIEVMSPFASGDGYICPECHTRWKEASDRCAHTWTDHVDEMGDEGRACHKCGLFLTNDVQEVPTESGEAAPIHGEAQERALRAAVDAYDTARLAVHGQSVDIGGMSDVNKRAIAPMIQAAIAAYEAAMKGGV